MGGHICIPMADSRWRRAEANTVKQLNLFFFKRHHIGDTDSKHCFDHISAQWNIVIQMHLSNKPITRKTKGI